MDLERFARRLAGPDLDAVILNLQGMQDIMHKASLGGRKADRETTKERCYMTAVVVGALIYDLAVLGGEEEAHARVLAVCRLDSWAPELSRGLLFVHPERRDPA